MYFLRPILRKFSMITEIHLHNFQKHSDLILDLEKITILRGGSDRGKSAVVRALYWIFFNRPLSSETIFKKKGTKEFFAKIQYNGHVIIRGVDKEGHYYSLDGEIFRAVGTDMPAAVSKVLNVDTLNIGTQHEGPFLFNMSQGEASRYISGLVGLEEKDKALSLIEKNRREINSNINNLRQEKQKVTDRIRYLKKVKKMVSDINKIEETKNQINIKQSDEKHIIDIIEKLKSFQKDLECVKPLQKLSTIVDEIIQKTKQKTMVFSIVSEINNIWLKIQEASKIDEAGLICVNLISEQEAIQKFIEKEKFVSDIIVRFEYNRNKAKYLQKEIEDLQKQWKKETKGFCPLCGKELDVV